MKKTLLLLCLLSAPAMAGDPATDTALNYPVICEIADAGFQYEPAYDTINIMGWGFFNGMPSRAAIDSFTAGATGATEVCQAVPLDADCQAAHDKAMAAAKMRLAQLQELGVCR